MAAKRTARKIRPTVEMMKQMKGVHHETYKGRDKRFRQLSMSICYNCLNPFCICGLEKFHKTYQMRMQSNDDAQAKLEAFESKQATILADRIKELI